MGELASLLTAIGGLVGALVWPALVIAVLVMFRDPISALLRRDDVSVTAPGGLTFTAKRRADATDALVEASKAKDDKVISREQAAAEIEDTQRQLQSIADPVVLWVDDDPGATLQERQAMEALGISFDLCVSTDDALGKMELRTYDAVITDMRRPGDPRAGYTLLREMRKVGDATPVVFYTSSRSPEHVREAVTEGALGCTNRANELVQLVLTALKITKRAKVDEPSA